MKIKVQDGIFTLEFLTDDEGYTLIDAACPIRCGKCCSYWMDVPEVAVYLDIDPNRWECPHLRPTGCVLPRRKRPVQCTGYLCELALVVLHGLLTEEQISEAVKNNKQETAASYFNVQPPYQEVTRSKLKIRPRDKLKIDKALRQKELRRRKLIEGV